ncbi:MAG TPA: hybrid sensor histidine kinase/response regulator, partial [bacterium]|nr:hybrid sensor histidine kinase/response regulator [bacterium]
MGSLDATHFLLNCTMIGWGACGAALLRRDGTHAIGLGLLLGAVLTGFDSLMSAPFGLPLAGWSLLSCAGLPRIAPRLSATSTWLSITVLAALLHLAHAATPLQPIVWGLRPLDLITAVGLASLLSRAAPEHRWPLGCTAASLLFTGTVGEVGAPAATLLLAAAPWPLLADMLRRHTRELGIATATSFATMLALNVRATAAHRDLDLGLAAIEDPLATLALIVLVFGFTLLFADATARREQAAAAAERVARNEQRPAATHLTPAEVVRDLRGPLTSMLAAAHLAQAATGTGATPKALTQLQDYGRQLAAAMNDIEELERLLGGEVAPADEVFDLPELLASCVTATIPFADDRDVTVRFDAASSLPQWHKGDPSRLQQLFTRVLQLAIEHCPTGRVDVFAATRDDRLSLSLLNGQGDVDNPDDLGVVFARELARVLGGELELRRRDNGGTEFRVTLPLVPAPDWEVDLLEEDELATREQQVLTNSDVRGKVLLVTSSSDHRKLLASMLAAVGADVDTAAGSAMGLHLLGGDNYDLILLDMQGS